MKDIIIFFACVAGISALVIEGSRGLGYLNGMYDPFPNWSYHQQQGFVRTKCESGKMIRTTKHTTAVLGECKNG